MKQTSYVLNS